MNILDPGLYSFSYYSIPNFIAGCLVLSLGIITLRREKFSPVSLTFAFLALSYSGWQFADAILYLCDKPESGWFWSRVLGCSVILLPVSAYFFTLTAVQQYHRYRYLAWANVLIALVCEWTMAHTRLLVADTHRHFW